MCHADPESAADPHTKSLIEHFRSCSFDGITPAEYLGRGASSLVFKCHYGDKPAALKVFDPAFFREKAAAIELTRIRRQLDLRPHPHPHVVSIYNAGFSTEANAHFLLMQYCEGTRLSDAIARVPRANIRSLISQLASGAEHLEDLGFVHRDIKPDNIILSSDFSTATLLDLGVVMPLGVSDSEGATASLDFVGTTRYSPPEFILRTEEEPHGWRAITFYQLGAVLHDLIMQRPLFHDKQLKGRLYYAIFTETPLIESLDAPLDLITLARLCLHKRPQDRLAGVTWTRFSESYLAPSLTQLRERVTALRTASSPLTPTFSAAAVPTTFEPLALAVKELLIADRELFPPHTYSLGTTDGALVFTFQASHSHRFSTPLHVALWPNLNPQGAIMSLSACAATGPSAHSALAANKRDAATAGVDPDDNAPHVALRICAAAMLSVCEKAGLETDGATVFHLGHYL